MIDPATDAAASCCSELIQEGRGGLVRVVEVDDVGFEQCCGLVIASP